MSFKSKQWFHKHNGSKGGRPRQDSGIYIKIPKIKFVNLTSQQYENLINRYGQSILLKAIVILDNWLKSGSPNATKFIGKNNYSHFRSDGWVINEAKRSLQQVLAPNITKN